MYSILATIICLKKKAKAKVNGICLRSQSALYTVLSHFFRRIILYCSGILYTPPISIQQCSGCCALANRFVLSFLPYVCRFPCLHCCASPMDCATVVRLEACHVSSPRRSKFSTFNVPTEWMQQYLRTSFPQFSSCSVE